MSLQSTPGQILERPSKPVVWEHLEKKVRVPGKCHVRPASVLFCFSIGAISGTAVAVAVAMAVAVACLSSCGSSCGLSDRGIRDTELACVPVCFGSAQIRTFTGLLWTRMFGLPPHLLTLQREPPGSLGPVGRYMEACNGLSAPTSHRLAPSMFDVGQRQGWEALWLESRA